MYSRTYAFLWRLGEGRLVRQLGILPLVWSIGDILVWHLYSTSHPKRWSMRHSAGIVRAPPGPGGTDTREIMCPLVGRYLCTAERRREGKRGFLSGEVRHTHSVSACCPPKSGPRKKSARPKRGPAFLSADLFSMPQPMLSKYFQGSIVSQACWKTDNKST